MSEAWEGGKGDKSRVSNLEAYRDNYDKIFGRGDAPWSEHSNKFIEEYPNHHDQEELPQ